MHRLTRLSQGQLRDTITDSSWTVGRTSPSTRCPSGASETHCDLQPGLRFSRAPYLYLASPSEHVLVERVDEEFFGLSPGRRDRDDAGDLPDSRLNPLALDRLEDRGERELSGRHGRTSE